MNNTTLTVESYNDFFRNLEKTLILDNQKEYPLSWICLNDLSSREDLETLEKEAQREIAEICVLKQLTPHSVRWVNNRDPLGNPLNNQGRFILTAIPEKP